MLEKCCGNCTYIEFYIGVFICTRRIRNPVIDGRFGPPCHEYSDYCRDIVRPSYGGVNGTPVNPRPGTEG